MKLIGIIGTSASSVTREDDQRHSPNHQARDTRRAATTTPPGIGHRFTRRSTRERMPARTPLCADEPYLWLCECRGPGRATRRAETSCPAPATEHVAFSQAKNESVTAASCSGSGRRRRSERRWPLVEPFAFPVESTITSDPGSHERPPSEQFARRVWRSSSCLKDSSRQKA